MNIEYMPNEELWKWADEFRDMYAPDKLPPVDVVYIAEVDLGMEPLLTPQLFPKIGMDAALASDLKSLYIDEDSYAVEAVLQETTLNDFVFQAVAEKLAGREVHHHNDQHIHIEATVTEPLDFDAMRRGSGYRIEEELREY